MAKLKIQATPLLQAYFHDLQMTFDKASDPLDSLAFAEELIAEISDKTAWNYVLPPATAVYRSA